MESRAVGFRSFIETAAVAFGAEPPARQLEIEAEKVAWSAWSRCESSFSFLLVPHKPGVFALAEEVAAMRGPAQRMLAMFAVFEAEDLARAISALFVSGNPWRERVMNCRCFVRYALLPEDAQRLSVHSTLQRWLEQASDRAAEISPSGAPVSEADEAEYRALPQSSFLHSDFADCDPADCSCEPGSGHKLDLQREGAVRRIRPPAFPAGF